MKLTHSCNKNLDENVLLLTESIFKIAIEFKFDHLMIFFHVDR